MTPQVFAFVALLALVTVTRLWLLGRQRSAVGRARDRVPAEFADDVPLAAHQKAADYTRAKIGIGGVETILEAGVALFITVGGGFALVDGFFRAHGLDGVALGLAVIAVIGGASALIGWPFSLYQTFIIEARFGFNRTSWALYLADCAKALLLALVLGAPLLAVVLWLMRTAGEHWWLYAWCVWFGFNVVLLWAYPAFIAPWFNRFLPLTDETLKAKVEALIARCGFSSRGVFVMDGSRRSSHGNAYFTGFGRNKRIVLFDTLVSRLAPEEVEAVLAHELGHYRLHHIRQRLIVSALTSLAALALLGWLTREPLFFEAFGVALPSAHAALVIFSIAAPLCTFWITPIAAVWSRRHEFAADEFAAAYTPASALARALVNLYKDNATSLTPDAVYSFFYDSHPPARIRIARLREPAP
ncbi:MAG TPA: M48 family metallopeptidase [Steroidobacteraceae bacterium]|nr:M48 family metallopeptidase [Steroidobacteraceae bacterium]